MKVRVLIVEDFPLVREALGAAVSRCPDFEVVALAADGREGLAKALELVPDIVTVDLHMPDCDGITLARQLRAEVPQVRVVVMTASERPEPLLDAVAAGVSGYLTKRSTGRELCDALRSVAAGGIVIAPTLAAHILRQFTDPTSAGEQTSLTSRERDVLRLVASGMTDAEVGERLHVSVRTVQTHLGAVRVKTGLRRRSELTRYAVENALA